LIESNKEYIRVYINSDTTFRSFTVANEETTAEFLRRILPKLNLSDDGKVQYINDLDFEIKGVDNTESTSFNLST